MKQMRVFSQRILSDDVIGRVLLETRANQSIMLHGYRMELMTPLGTAFETTGDRIDIAAVLQAAPQAPLAVQSLGTESLDAILKSRGTIGFVNAYYAARGFGGSGSFIDPGIKTTGWTPCDFEVPALFLVGWAGTVGSIVAASTVVVHLLFDWVTHSPLEIAALYTTYGMDAVDATERESSATGEIDFTKATGDGTKPGFVG